MKLKPIKVGYTSYETFIDDDTMQQVEALLAGNTYSQTCKKKFTDMRTALKECEEAADGTGQQNDQTFP